MKKFLIIMVAAMSLSLSATAQRPHGYGKKLSKEELVQKRTDKMVDELGLNQKQAAQLLELNKKYQDKFPAPRPGGPRRAGQKPSQKPRADVDAHTQATPQAPADSGQLQKRGEHGQHHKGMHGTPMSPKQRQIVREQYDKELQQILTKKQYKRYKAGFKKS